MKVRKYTYVNTNNGEVVFVCKATNRRDADASFEKYVGETPFTQYTALRLEVQKMPRTRA